MYMYFDGDIFLKDEYVLNEYLEICEKCRKYFYEMEKFIVFVWSILYVEVFVDFIVNVMVKLFKEKKRVFVKRWFRIYFVIVVVVVFIILMGGGFFNSWYND